MLNETLNILNNLILDLDFQAFNKLLNNIFNSLFYRRFIFLHI